MRRPFALALVLWLSACAQGPGPVHVVSVAVEGGSSAEPLREAGIGGGALDEAARLALRDAGFALGDGPRPHRAEVQVLAVRLAPPDAAGRPARVEVVVEIGLASVAPGKVSTARETGTGAAPLEGSTPGSAWSAALTGATREAAHGLALAFAEDAKPLAKVIADLSAKDRRLRDQAVRVVAERRSREAVPALLQRLQDEDPQIAHRTVGALAQIGDERAVGPLIDLSRTGDPMLAARVARLIGDIGGPEAEGYLLTLEAGHPDRRVRVAAREALGEMAERERQASAVSVRK